MAVPTTKEKKQLRRMSPVAGMVRMDRILQYMDTTNGVYLGPASPGYACVGGTGGVAADDIVYASGWDTTEECMVVLKADADTIATMSDLYIATAAVAEGATGHVYKHGYITGANTNSYSGVGSPVYLSGTAGGTTHTEPTGTARVVEVGTILVKSTTIGVINVDLGGAERIPLHDHADNAGGGTLSSIGGLTGTTNTSFEIDTDGSVPAIALGVGTTGDYTQTIKPAATLTVGDADITIPNTASVAGVFVLEDTSQILTNKTLTTPTISSTGFTNAQHNHSAANSGGAIAASAAITGTTSDTFDVDSDTTTGGMQLDSTPGGANYKVVLRSEITTGLSADAVMTLPADTDQIVGRATTDTLTNKTLTAPTINAATLTGTVTISGTPTISGTWTDLGIVTAVDINGGTIDGSAIGANSAGSGAFTTLAASGATMLAGDLGLAAGKDITLLPGAGYIKINAAASGSLKFLPTALTAQDITLATAAQTGSSATISIPDLTGSNDTFATLGLGNAFTGACTFASITGNDASLGITGTAGSGAAGKPIVIAGGLGAAGFDGGLVSTTGGEGGTTGNGGAVSLVGGQSGNGAAADGGAVAVTGGAGVGSGASLGGDITITGGVAAATGTGGDVTITSGASGGGTGTAGALSIDTGTKSGGAPGAMTIAGTYTEALGIGNASCTVTVTGALAMAAGGSITLTEASGDGCIRLNGGTAGALEIVPVATPGGAHETKLTTGTGQTADAVVTLPVATCTLPGLGLANIFTDTQTVDYSASLTNAVRDLLVLSHETDGTPAAGLGVGLTFEITDKTAATPEEQASIDAVMTDTTSTSEDCDLVFNLNSDGTMREAFRIVAASEVDSADNVVINGNTQETDGVVNVLTVKANPAAAVASGFGAGISVWLSNDAGSPVEEEHASIDFVTGAADGAEDTDIVFKTMLDGTVTEALRLDASANTFIVGKDASKVTKLQIYPTTTAKGFFALAAVDNTNDFGVTLTHAASDTANRTYTFGNAGADKYVAYTAQTDGTIDRSDLTQETLAKYRIPLMTCRNGNGTVLDATGGAGLFKITAGGTGSGTLVLTGEDATNGTKTDILMFEFAVPPEYVASETIECDVEVKVDESGAGVAGTETLQIECFELAAAGTVGSDLASDGAQDLTAAGDGFQTVTSTITDAGIAAGDKLIFIVTLIVTETNGTAVHGEIGDINVQMDIKG